MNDCDNRTKDTLLWLAKEGTLPHLLLFLGLATDAKEECALELAKTLLKTERQHHSDLHIYRPEGKTAMHSIESMRALSHQVYLAPLESDKKVFLIYDADRMLPTSANALLKTFEEPTLDTVIILLAPSDEKLLSTIVSRCCLVVFTGKKEMGEPPYRKPLLDLLACGGVIHGKEWERCIQAIEEAQKQVSEEGEKEDLTAHQRAAIEKEEVGNATIQALTVIDDLLEIFFSWFRDLHVVSIAADSPFLKNLDYADIMIQRAQIGALPDLERIDAALAQARLSIQRFMPLSSVLETLLLKCEG